MCYENPKRCELYLSVRKKLEGIDDSAAARRAVEHIQEMLEYAKAKAEFLSKKRFMDAVKLEQPIASSLSEKLGDKDVLHF